MKTLFFLSVLILGVLNESNGYPKGKWEFEGHRDRMHPYYPPSTEKKETDQQSTEPMHGFVKGDTLQTNWIEHGKAELRRALERTLKIQHAKNIIFFVGDGMGISTTSMARIFKAQERNLTGNAALLSWEHFPYSALSRTYDTVKQVPDSASSGTALICGVKTEYGALGVNQNVIRGNCSSVAGNEVKSVVKYAQEAGKWTGIVSTSRVTHATPAAAYAHSAERDWESDANLEEDGVTGCKDIAVQLIEGECGRNLKVILGGGRENFFPNGTTDVEYEDEKGTRLDGRDLTQEWVNEKINNQGIAENKVKYVYNKTEFDAVDADSVEYLMGLFEPGHMNFETERENDTAGEPSLAEMVEKSIDILSRNEQGYFLYVEGGRIDHAHHDNLAHVALTDTLALQDAVEKAVNKTSEEDTLIIVTADHSHAFAFAGYVDLPEKVLGIAGTGEDGKPYTAAGYTNGPAFEYHRADENGTEVPRRNLTGINVEAANFPTDAGIPRSSETHAGEDVAIYARGPLSHLFHGTREQNYVAYVMMYASCTGAYFDNCELPNQLQCTSISSMTSVSITAILLSCLLSWLTP